MQSSKKLLPRRNTIQERNRTMQTVIDNYYKSIEQLEFDMRAKRDEIRLRSFENPQHAAREQRELKRKQKLADIEEEKRVEAELLKYCQFPDHEAIELLTAMRDNRLDVDKKQKTEAKQAF